MPEQPVVLVTGASSGIGQATARSLARQGYRVLGTSRNPHGVGDTPGVAMLPLDVRSDQSVAACLRGVTELAGLATVLEIAVSRRPRLRYVVRPQAKLVTRLRRFLPEGAFERGVRNAFRLDREG